MTLRFDALSHEPRPGRNTPNSCKVTLRDRAIVIYTWGQKTEHFCNHLLCSSKVPHRMK